MKRIVIALCLLAGLGSCQIYRTYQRPELPEVDSLFRQPVQGADTTSLADLTWRELFTDSRLQRLIDSGIMNNSDLQIARLRVAEARASLTASRLAYLPSLSLTPQGGGQCSGACAGDPHLRFGGSRRMGGRPLRKTAQREARGCGCVGRAGGLPSGGRDAAGGDRRQQLLYAADVGPAAGNHAQHVGSLGRERAGHGGAQTGRPDDRDGRGADRGGAGVGRGVGACARASGSPDGERALRAARHDAPHHRPLDAQRFPDSLAAGIPLRLVDRRPDVRQCEAALAEAYYATNTARSAFYPSITLGGTAGWTNAAGAAISNPGQWLFTAVGSLVEPLFARGRNRANLKIAQAQQQEALVNFRQSLLTAGAEVNDALVQWQTARRRLELDNRQVEALRSALRSAELLMQHSSQNYLEVLTARQALLQAELDAASDCFDKIQGIINLYHALGGGY